MTLAALEAPRAGRTSEGRRGRTRGDPRRTGPPVRSQTLDPSPGRARPRPNVFPIRANTNNTFIKAGGRWLGSAARNAERSRAKRSVDFGQISPWSGKERETDLCFMKRKRLNNCKSAVANSCQITINSVTRDPPPSPPPPALRHSSWTLSGKTNGGIRDLWRGNGSQVEECDWWGSPARLGGRSKKKKKKKKNQSLTLPL